MIFRGDYMQCLRRYPDTSAAKCRVEGDRHSRCLKLNRTWKPSDSLQAQKLLEMYVVCGDSATVSPSAAYLCSRLLSSTHSSVFRFQSDVGVCPRV